VSSELSVYVDGRWWYGINFGGDMTQGLFGADAARRDGGLREPSTGCGLSMASRDLLLGHHDDDDDDNGNDLSIFAAQASQDMQ
jgi:hypothetical protein